MSSRITWPSSSAVFSSDPSYGVVVTLPLCCPLGGPSAPVSSTPGAASGVNIDRVRNSATRAASQHTDAGTNSRARATRPPSILAQGVPKKPVCTRTSPFPRPGGQPQQREARTVTFDNALAKVVTQAAVFRLPSSDHPKFESDPSINHQASCFRCMPLRHPNSTRSASFRSLPARGTGRYCVAASPNSSIIHARCS